MYHSITIGDKNTFDDWHLLSVNPPFVAPPAPKLNYVDILGANGSLDYTEALTKMPRYQDRQGSWEFIVLNPGDTDRYTIRYEGDYKYDWASLYSEIMAYLHGKYFDNIILEDDPYFTYRGRVWVNEWRSSAQWNQIVLNYRLEPFKYSTRSLHENQVTVPADQSGHIVFSNNVGPISIIAPKGTDASPIFIYGTSTRDGYSILNPNGYAVCRAHFINPELNIDYFFTMYGPYGNRQIGMRYPIDDYNNNRKCTNYYYYDRINEIYPACVSNIKGDNVCTIEFGAYNANDIIPGPATINYWWVEARL